MKTRIYLRVARTKRGCAVHAATKPNHAPLATPGYKPQYHPTVIVALEIEIPDKEFEASRILLQAKITQATPAVEIKQVRE
jgi:hypothetical protein